jgi:hypothetical protein
MQERSCGACGSGACSHRRNSNGTRLGSDSFSGGERIDESTAAAVAAAAAAEIADVCGEGTSRYGTGGSDCIHGSVRGSQPRQPLQLLRWRCLHRRRRPQRRRQTRSYASRSRGRASGEHSGSDHTNDRTNCSGGGSCSFICGSTRSCASCRDSITIPELHAAGPHHHTPAPLVLLLTSGTQAAIADASLAVSDAACSGVWGFARVLRLEHGGMQAWRADVTCGTDDVPLLRVRSLCGAVTSSVVQGCVGAFLCPCLAMLVRWLAVGTQSVAVLAVLGCVRLRCWSRVRQVLSGVLHAVQA